MLAITLFLIYFSVISLFLYTPSEKEIESPVNTFETFYEAVKEVLTTSEDGGEGDDNSEPSTITKTTATKSHLKPSHFTIQQLRKLICTRQLQEKIKERFGKPVNRCRKDELLSVLFA